MGNGKGTKLKTPPSAQMMKRKRPLNRHSDPQPKKKMFQDSSIHISNIEHHKTDPAIRKKLLSKKKEKASPKINMHNKRGRDDDDDDDDDILNIDSDDLNELDFDDDDDNSEMEPSDDEDDYKVSPKRSKLSIEKKSKKPARENIKHNIDEAELNKDRESKLNRDRKTLFLTNLKMNVNVDDVKSLSKDIIDVRIHNCIGKKKKEKKYAFVEFADEVTAEKNKKMLCSKKLEGVEITVDYVGEKSSKKPNVGKLPDNIDTKMLYVSGLQSTVMEDEIAKMFPGSVKIDLVFSRKDHTKKYFAFVRYADEAKCLEDHKLGQDLMFEGRKLMVHFANIASRIKHKRQKNLLREKRQKLHKENKTDGPTADDEQGQSTLVDKSDSPTKTKSLSLNDKPQPKKSLKTAIQEKAQVLGQGKKKENHKKNLPSPAILNKGKGVAIDKTKTLKSNGQPQPKKLTNAISEKLLGKENKNLKKNLPSSANTNKDQGFNKPKISGSNGLPQPKKLVNVMSKKAQGNMHVLEQGKKKKVPTATLR